MTVPIDCQLQVYGVFVAAVLVLLLPNELMSMLGLDNRRREADLVAICQRVLEERRRSNNSSNRNRPNVLDNGPPSKRRKSKWNWERGRRCVEYDYWGPSPRFNDRQFERVFRISRHFADLVLAKCGSVDPFFTQRIDAVTGKAAICPKVKLLMGLKLLSYGVSPTAFQDYFQMGESTANRCLQKLCSIVANDADLKQTYLRDMNRSDALKTSALHLERHGVPGMLGSLDCMLFD